MTGQYQGQTNDTDLTDLGKAQAMGAAEKLYDKNIQMIYTSPLKRTKQTAKIIGQTLNLQVICEDLLKETDHGDWSFLNDEQISQKWPEMYELWKTHPAQVVFPNGEDFANQTAKRVINWWNKFDKNVNTVLVAHENVLQIIITYVLGQPLDRIWEHRVANGAIICVNNAKIEIC